MMRTSRHVVRLRAEWVGALLALGMMSCSEPARDAAPAQTQAPAQAPAATAPAPAPPAAGAPTPVLPEPASPREAAARAAVGELRSTLMQALQSSLAAGGPEAAIVVCRDIAPGLAAKINAASSDGIRVGRTSHRLRNPANAPEPWVQPTLDAYASGAEARPSLTVDLPDGSLGYVEPIKVQAPCLSCHGDPALGQIPEGVRAKLAESYPQDAATGFKEGDFRGLIWAVVPPAK